MLIGVAPANARHGIRLPRHGENVHQTAARSDRRRRVRLSDAESDEIQPHLADVGTAFGDVDGALAGR